MHSNLDSYTDERKVNKQRKRSITRGTGKSPREKKTNPRAKGTNPKAKKKRKKLKRELDLILRVASLKEGRKLSGEERELFTIAFIEALAEHYEVGARDAA
jgi:hypothetical protein